MASIDSRFAASMKPQVFTRITSAAASSGTPTAACPTRPPTRLPAPAELGLQHVEERLHLEVIIGHEGERRLGAVEGEGGFRAFEVVALGYLFGSLVHRVVDFLEVGAGRDVERCQGCHRG